MLGFNRKRPPQRKENPVAKAHERLRELSASAAQTAPSGSYLDSAASGSRPLISERQREKVVKYVNELAEDFELCVQTGSLACNYFDRYLASLTSRMSIKPPSDRSSNDKRFSDKRFIQMCASTCLLIAAKFSDRKLPPLSELEKVHHGRVKPDEFASLELDILQGLLWKLHVPLPHVFIEHLRALCPGSPFSAAVEDRANFFIDLSVYGYHFLNYTPAAIAAAAMLTAWKFSEEVESVSKHLRTLASAVTLEPHELTACVNHLVRYYGSCFPESADKVQHAALFIPISHTNERETPTEHIERPEQPDTPTDFANKTRAEGTTSRASAEEIAKPTAAMEAGLSSASVEPHKVRQPQPLTTDPQRATPESILDVDKAIGS